MILYYFISLFVFLLDQFTKWLVKTKMVEGQDQISVIGDFFMIVSHRNRGAAFGILQGQTVFFLAVTVIFLAGIIYYLHRTRKEGRKLVPLALSLMLGGAFGNFLDRAIHGEVVDFLQFVFRIGDWVYEFPIFNVADSGIVVGALLVLTDTLIAWRKEAKQEALAKEANSES